jgi:hypothetical protein
MRPRSSSLFSALDNSTPLRRRLSQTQRSHAAAGSLAGGQKVTRAEPRPGEQRSGAPAPKGELSGERDNIGTAEALGQGG